MKKVTLKNLIFPIVVLFITVLLLIFIPFKEVLHPQKADNVYEIIARYQEKERYVDVALDEITYTGYDNCNSKGERIGSYYYALDDANGIKCAFLLLPADKNAEPLEKITGYSSKARFIKQSEKNIKFLEAFSKEIGWELNDINDISGGIIISQAEYKPGIIIAIGVVSGLIAALCIAYIIAIIVVFNRKKGAIEAHE